MKRVWTIDELSDHWTLVERELDLVDQANTDKNRFGLAILLKSFQYQGRFPKRKRDIPKEVLHFGVFCTKSRKGINQS